ncbi:MAG: hypothetical protein WA755_20255 [Candidatus Acidiferrales bacterium]
MEQSNDAIVLGLTMMGGAFRAKISELMVITWKELFEREDPRLLRKAFRKIADRDDRFPTPARLHRVLGDLKPQAGGPTHTEGFDKDGVPCWFWSDEPTIPAYRAKDCTEGQVLLATLARIADRMESPTTPANEKKRRAELQQQKVEMHKKFGEGRVIA